MYFSIGLCIVLLVIFVVCLSQIWHFRTGHTLKEWKKIVHKIRQLRREDLQQLPAAIAQALRQVLTDHPGYGQLERVPRVLDQIAFEVNAAPIALRSLSALLIMTGLFATVASLSIAFSKLYLSTNQSLSAGAIKTALQSVLPTLYIPNAIAIALAVLLFILQYFWRIRNDRILTTAGKAYSQLDAAIADVDPALVLALNKVSEQFQQWMSNVNDDYTSKIERLLSQIRTLGEGIQQMVNSSYASVRAEDGALLSAVIDVSRRVESVNQRIDGGFEKLIAPLATGFEYIPKLSGMSDQFANAADRISKLDLSGPLGSLESTTRQVATSMEQLPVHIQKSLAAVTSDSSKSLETAITSAVGERTDQLLKSLQQIAVIQANLSRHNQTGLAALNDIRASLAQLPQALASQNGNELADTLKRLNAMAASLQESVRGMPGDLSEALQPLITSASGDTSMLERLITEGNKQIGEGNRQTQDLMRKQISAATEQWKLLNDASIQLRQMSSTIGSITNRSNTADLEHILQKLTTSQQEAFGRLVSEIRTLKDSIKTTSSQSTDPELRRVMTDLSGKIGALNLNLDRLAPNMLATIQGIDSTSVNLQKSWFKRIFRPKGKAE